MWEEDPPIETTFDTCQFSLDTCKIYPPHKLAYSKFYFFAVH